MGDTRVFFVTDSTEDNEELFTSLESAQDYIAKINKKFKPRIRVCLVKNAFKERHGSWNYDDLSDTFEPIKEVV